MGVITELGRRGQSIFELLYEWASRIGDGDVKNKERENLEAYILALERLTQDSPRNDLQDRLTSILEAAYCIGITPQCTTAVKAYLHSALIELIVPWKDGQLGVFSRSEDRFAFGNHYSEQILVRRAKFSEEGEPLSEHHRAEDDSPDNVPEILHILFPFSPRFIQPARTRRFISKDRRDHTTLFLHPANISWPTRTEDRLLREVLLLSRGPLMDDLVASEYGQLQHSRFGHRSGQYPENELEPDISSEIAREASRNVGPIVFTLQVELGSDSAAKCGQALWAIGSALESIPGVTAIIDELERGSILANITIRMRSMWERDRVEELLVAVPTHADLPATTGASDSETAELRLELEKLRKLLIGKDGDGASLDDSPGYSKARIELDLRERQVIIKERELKAREKELELIRKASGLMRDGMVVADPVRLFLEGELLYSSQSAIAAGQSKEELARRVTSIRTRLMMSRANQASIDYLSLPERIRGILRSSGIYIVKDLVDRLPTITEIRGIGNVSKGKIKEALDEFHLELIPDSSKALLDE